MVCYFRPLRACSRTRLEISSGRAILNNQTVLRRALNTLSLVLLTATWTGCGFFGQRLAETTDPFLSDSTQQMANEQAPVSLPAIEATEPGQIQLTSFNASEDILLQHPVPAPQPMAPDEIVSDEPTEIITSGVYPIDLANALGLGGADSLQIRLARTQLFQAQARHFQAKTLWLPSLRMGVGYNKHDGQLQETEGNVLEVNRNSLFYGGGFGLGSVPIPGGAAGPPRLFVALSLADAWFKPLSACQEVAASGAGERVAQNDSLADIAIAYHGLVESHGRLANVQHALGLSERMVDQVSQFEQEGFSSKTEVSRARVDRSRWQRAVADARRQTIVRSAKLARMLRLPPQVQLVPAEEFVLPIEFVDPDMDIDFLISQGLAGRPEVAQYKALREAACFRVKEEEWRPWIPNVQVAASGGGFGGGPSTQFPGTASRSDVDILAVWELKNLGLGNVALQRIRRGELHQRLLELEEMRDRIAAEVVAAAADVTSYRQQMDLAREAIDAAGESYQLNEERIRASEGLPIELLQSISALTEAQNAYTEAVASYNRSQYRLMRAVGNPADVPTP